MFKKASDVKALQRLSGADRKKLRRTIRERFPKCTDADIDVLLPLKAEVSVSKLANRVHVYAVEAGQPMLFDVDGRGADIFPTVYALWKLPNLLPSFLLKGAEVSRYVVGGADLMFPGVQIPPEGYLEFKAGEAWAVKVPGNEYPIAVGATTMSSAEASKAGYRGKALRILHYYPDTLWQTAEGKYVPNGGFTEEIVTSNPSREEAPGEEKRDAVVTDARDNDGAAQVQEGESGTPDECLTEAVKELKVVEVEGTEETEAGNFAAATATISTEEMDALLEWCLLQALHTTVKDKDLPMPASTLWSSHILPCRPAGSTLDIKKSSFKKLSKWLQAVCSLGLISAKEDRHRKEVMLLQVDRKHALYQGFVPEKKVAAEASAAVKHDGEAPSRLEIVELWKCTTHVASIFNALAADTGKYYTASEAADIAFKYVEKESLVKPTDNAVVILDATLCDALFKGAVKKGSAYPTEIHKKDLGAAFLNRMQANHRVIRGSESVVKKGASKSVQITTERRQGNKKVTRVVGVESFLVNADALAAELQKKFACSTSVAELPGKKGESEVLIQGGVLEDLGRHLVQQYGIPKRFIEIMDKTRK